MDWSAYGYAGLFVSSFISATVLPMSSEVVFSAFVVGKVNLLYCVLWASLGNFLGGMTGYYLGWLGRWDWIERYLGVKHASVEKWRGFCDKYGILLAFFCWLPFIGDLFCVALGFIKANVWQASAGMLLGKVARYTVLGYLLSKYGMGILQ